MKISSSQISSSVAVSLALCLNLAAAHPYHHRVLKSRCQGQDIASQIVCGDAGKVDECIARSGSDEPRLESCLQNAGCTPAEAQVEAVWASKRCQGGDESSQTIVEEVVIELREVRVEERADETTTDTASSSTTATSSTSTSDTTTTSATTSSTATSTDSSTSTSATSTASSSSSSSSSSSTASSTSSSTATSTSSTASATSTSSSESATDAFGAWVWIIASVMGIYAAVCAGCICWKCCSERNERKKAAKLADEKEALAQMKN